MPAGTATQIEYIAECAGPAKDAAKAQHGARVQPRIVRCFIGQLIVAICDVLRGVPFIHPVWS